MNLIQANNLDESPENYVEWKKPVPKGSILCDFIYVTAVVWMLIFPSPQINILKPNSQCDSIARWGLWEVIMLRGRTFLNEISALKKKALESCLAPSTMWGHGKKVTSMRKRPSPDMESAGTLNLDFPDSRIVRNRCLLFISHTVYNVFVLEA